MQKLKHILKLNPWNKMKWIEKIIEIHEYQIRLLWNDGYERIVDLKKFIIEKSANKNNSYAILLDKNYFRTAQCDGNSIFWGEGVEYLDLDGSKKLGPLDISPEVLFEMSMNFNSNKIELGSNLI